MGLLLYWWLRSRYRLVSIPELDPLIPAILRFLGSFDLLNPSQGQKKLSSYGITWSSKLTTSTVCLNCHKHVRAVVMRHHVVLVPLTSICLSSIFAHPFPVGSIVETSSGAIIGHAAQNRTRVSEYLGIPYAKPPLGDLRFAAPQTYTSAQTYNASKFVCSKSSFGRCYIVNY